MQRQLIDKSIHFHYEGTTAQNSQSEDEFAAGDYLVCLYEAENGTLFQLGYLTPDTKVDHIDRSCSLAISNVFDAVEARVMRQREECGVVDKEYLSRTDQNNIIAAIQDYKSSIKSNQEWLNEFMTVFAANKLLDEFNKNESSLIIAKYLEKLSAQSACQPGFLFIEHATALLCYLTHVLKGKSSIEIEENGITDDVVSNEEQLAIINKVRCCKQFIVETHAMIDAVIRAENKFKRAISPIDLVIIEAMTIFKSNGLFVEGNSEQYRSMFAVCFTKFATLAACPKPGFIFKDLALYILAYLNRFLEKNSILASEINRISLASILNTVCMLALKYHADMVKFKMVDMLVDYADSKISINKHDLLTFEEDVLSVMGYKMDINESELDKMIVQYPAMELGELRRSKKYNPMLFSGADVVDGDASKVNPPAPAVKLYALTSS